MWVVLTPMLWFASLPGMLKLVVLGAVGEFATTAAFDVNVVLNLAMFLVVAMASIPLAKSKRKDATIKDLNEVVAAKDKRNVELEKSLRQLEQGCQHLKTDLAASEARYEEAKKYTAKEAVEHFEGSLAAHSEKVAERHGLLLAQGEATASALAQVADALNRVEQRLNGQPEG